MHYHRLTHFVRFDTKTIGGCQDVPIYLIDTLVQYEDFKANVNNKVSTLGYSIKKIIVIDIIILLRRSTYRLCIPLNLL